jgi:hypothetical protein
MAERSSRGSNRSTEKLIWVDTFLRCLWRDFPLRLFRLKKEKNAGDPIPLFQSWLTTTQAAGTILSPSPPLLIMPQKSITNKNFYILYTPLEGVNDKSPKIAVFFKYIEILLLEML